MLPYPSTASFAQPASAWRPERPSSVARRRAASGLDESADRQNLSRLYWDTNTTKAKIEKQFGIPPGKVHDHLLGRPALMNCEFCGTDMEWHSRSARESRAAKCPACLHRSAGHCYCARCKAVVARKEASEEASRAAARKA